MKFKELPTRSTACLQINQIQYMVDVPHLVTYPNWTPIFHWCVVRCGSKNGHQKDMCTKDIGLCAQNLFTIQGLNNKFNWGRSAWSIHRSGTFDFEKP